MRSESRDDVAALSRVREAVLAAGFDELLEHGLPVTGETIAARARIAVGRVAEVLEHLRLEGRAVLAADGRVTGVLGLSAVPTRHEIVFAGRRRWTWCAYDAVGILGALRATGVARSQSPLSGATIEVAFDAGRPASGAVVLFIPADDVDSVVEQWCPLANLFEDGDAARAWQREARARGHVISIDVAARTAGRRWSEVLSSAGSGARDPGHLGRLHGETTWPLPPTDLE